MAEYVLYSEQMEPAFAQIRWLEELQNDFAARADWCVRDYAQANHPPSVKLKGKQIKEVKPGQRVRLRAKATDPDGDALTVGWWQYSAAGTYGDRETADVSLENAEYYVPEDIKPGETIHLIFQVKDGGKPALVRYGRIVLVGK